MLAVLKAPAFPTAVPFPRRAKVRAPPGNSQDRAGDTASAGAQLGLAQLSHPHLSLRSFQGSRRIPKEVFAWRNGPAQLFWGKISGSDTYPSVRCCLSLLSSSAPSSTTAPSALPTQLRARAPSSPLHSKSSRVLKNYNYSNFSSPAHF